jgi:peptide/nickel transport system substrate-binding protein/oligopeptide transport system substrate-binding protein
LKHNFWGKASRARYRNIALFAVCAACAAAIFSCATGAPREKKAEDAREAEVYAETRPDIADRETLVVSFPAEEIEFDFRKSYSATEAQIYTALYEGLFSYHPFTMEPVPAAAEKWKLSDDKKEWTFTLRPHLRYWNGDAVRAADFRDAWLSSIAPESGAPYASLFDIIEGALEYRLGLNADAETVGIKALDDRTLVVRLASPASFFPAMLCHHSFSPLNPAMGRLENWNNQPVVSNGPFFLSKKSDGSLTLSRNELYWDAREVALKKIVIKLGLSGDAAAELWNSGEARWVSGHVNYEKLKDRSGLELNPSFATHYYYIRSAHAPWNDYRVRQALALALPWQKIRAGYLLPAKTLIYPISGYPEIEGLATTDMAAARGLLESAGFPGAKGLPELVLRLSPGSESERIGAHIVQAWRDGLGLKVKIEVIPFPAYFDSLKQDNYDVGFSTWIGDFADPYTFLQMWRRDSSLNDAGYNDTDYEKLLDRSMAEDGEKRYKTLSEAEELLLDRGTVLPISHSYAVNVVDTAELEGWYRTVLDIHPFKYLSYRTREPLPSVALSPVRKRSI